MTPAGGAVPAVTEVRVRRAARTLVVGWDDGRRASLPAEYLRVESPSAEVQGHAPDQRVLVAGKREVGIDAAEPVGNYALRLRFSDGHDTGLFTWSFLRQLADEHDARWAAYLEALAARGLAREGLASGRPLVVILLVFRV